MRKTSKSSDRQKEIFQFIKAFLLEKGYPPSVREIGEAVGLKSSSTVHSYLSRLEANGMIKRDPTKPRAIDILDERPWRQNVPVPMLIGIHKGAALFDEKKMCIRDSLYAICIEYASYWNLYFLLVDAKPHLENESARRRAI